MNRAERNERNKRVCAAYVGGKTLAEVGAEYGLHSSTVWAVLHNGGVKRRRRGNTTAAGVSQRDQDIAAMYAGGISQSEIARRIGVSRQRIFQIVNSEAKS